MGDMYDMSDRVCENIWKQSLPMNLTTVGIQGTPTVLKHFHTPFLSSCSFFAELDTKVVNTGLEWKNSRGAFSKRRRV